MKGVPREEVTLGRVEYAEQRKQKIADPAEKTQ